MSTEDKSGTALVLRPQQSRAISAAYEPQDFPQAMQMAATLGKAAGLTPEVAYLKMAAGSDYGIPAVTALRMFDIIDGPGGTKQPAPRAQLLVAMCLRERAVCEYFRCVDSTETSATYETKRAGDPPQRETYTIEQAKKAKLIRDGGAWDKDPSSMLLARASSRLARRVYPDVVGGMYSAEERDAVDATPLPVSPLPREEPRVVLDSTAEPAHDTATGEVWTDAQRALIEALGTARDRAALDAARKQLTAIWPKAADAPADIQALYKEAKERVEAIEKEGR